MARGFESKSVEAQQDEHQRPKESGARLSPADLTRLSRRRTLELSRARAAADLLRAATPAYRRMLETALRAIDDEIALMNQG